MQTLSIAFISRAHQYSPDSVGADMAILSAVRKRLVQRGHHCCDITDERQLDAGKWCVGAVDLCVSMARTQDALNSLGCYEKRFVPVVNSTASVMICKQRTLLMELLDSMGIPVAPAIGPDGYWVKRDYGYTETASDVQYAPTLSEARRIQADMEQRGIESTTVCAHVVGDLVKFYGVRGTDFFRYTYPTDDGSGKFGHGVINGRPHHYAFSVAGLRQIADRAAGLVMADIYGGDCIIRRDGSPVIIDLNDWPSFSCCREEAADAITTRITEIIKNDTRTAYIF